MKLRPIRDARDSGWDILAPFQVVPAIPGDYDGNGIVGPEDYDVWKSNFGSTVNLAADGNHVIDAADYSVWRDKVGATLGTSGGSAGPLPSHAGVPEPSALPLVVTGTLAMCFRRRADAPYTHSTVTRSINRPRWHDRHDEVSNEVLSAN